MLASLAIYSVVAWILWRVLKLYFVRSPLDVIPGPPPASLIVGNVLQLDSWEFHHELMKYGGIARMHGPLGRRWLSVYDPVALQNILLKDQNKYDEPSWFIEANSLFFGSGVLSVTGDLHRKQRKMLMPVFSAKHLKAMTPIFHEVARRLVDALSSRVASGPQELDILAWMGRTALELIGQAGLGCSLDPLVTDSAADPLALAAKEFTTLAFRPEMVIVRQIIPYTLKLGTPQFRRWLVERIPIARFQRLKETVDVFDRRSTEILRAHKVALEKAQKDGSHEDDESKNIISVLLKANLNTSEDDRMPDDQVLGQMATLLFAATDTTSYALTHTLHVLCQHPDAQQRLRTEVLEAMNGNDLSYDDLHNLPYLDAVCRETLRLYPPAPNALREAAGDTVLPLSTPIRARDGSVIQEVPIPNGTFLILNNLASNTNPAIWGADAHEWKPERWLQPLPKEVENAPIPGVYSHLMTFLGGSRSCIGFKFSQLEMKVVLASLITNFEFELSDKPIFWNLSGLMYPSLGKDSPTGEMWLRLKRCGTP